MEWKPGSMLEAELQGAHGVVKLDPEGLPESCSSAGMGYSSAQGVIVAIEM